jgi:uncharacterized membrane protein
MSTAVLPKISSTGWEMSSVAEKSLKAATRLWFGVTVVGQLTFGFAVVSFYGLTALRGDYHGWTITNGHMPGITPRTPAVAMHLISAVIVMLAGAVQLVPGVRKRFPAFHRWNGRIYMLTAVVLSGAGIYMTWSRGSVGDIPQHLGSTLNLILIWIFAALALRYALARDFATHRRWALRMFIVLSGSWFIRIMLFLTLAVFKGPVGFDPTTFTGSYLTFLSFADYLLPLGILEMYFLAQARPGALRRVAMAAALFVLTLLMAAGLFVLTMGIWVPQVKAGFDPRTSIAETLSKTIDSSSIDAAVKQYHDLKAASAPNYNFDETELNNLGYQLLNKKKFKQAIRVFQLNVEAYPKSSNVYDSLGEGYMDDGDKQLAIDNYEKSIQLNPKNQNGIAMLRKLRTP